MGLKVGDKVRIKLNGATGEVVSLYDFLVWGAMESECSVRLDDGSGTVTIGEKSLELIDAPRDQHGCICGAKHTRNPMHHARWCDLYEAD